MCAVSLPDVEDAVQCFLTADAKIVSLNPEKLNDSLAGHSQRRCGHRQAGGRRHPHPGPGSTPPEPRRQDARFAATARCLPGMARSPDDGRQLDSRTGGPGGRRVWHRRGRGAYAAHHLGYAGRLPAGGAGDYAVRVQDSAVAGGPVAADGASAVAGAAGRATEPVYVADGNAYYNRPGPRIVESAEILAEMLHPEVCAPALAVPGVVRAGVRGLRINLPEELLVAVLDGDNDGAFGRMAVGVIARDTGSAGIVFGGLQLLPNRFGGQGCPPVRRLHEAT